ncbi:MAG: esterase family protein [Bacteroidetes bacterium]|nr:esterase family protein [Fibrella sp.]
MAHGLPASAGPSGSASVTVVRDDSLVSVPLKRSVRLDVLLPPGYPATGKLTPQTGPLPVLYLNDGQDLPRLKLRSIMDSLIQKQEVPPFVIVAIHAGDRIQEYGTATQADYLNRGSKAAAYTDFVLTELLPYVQKHYPVTNDPAQSVFAGFSLGGLSAFDLVWHHPQRFSKAGVFSGSFWWRSKGLDSGYADETDRIMHSLVRAGTYQKSLTFWIQTGTDDETDDRDHDGIIDSIDDTLDIIAELERKGYRWNRDIRYVEVKGGQHNPDTWRRVMPEFLTWAFGVK